METVIPVYQVSPRSGMIITLGVLSLIIFGPLTGVVGWILANQDIRDVSAGRMPSTERSRIQVGRVLNIIGTFLSPIWAIIYAALTFAFLSIFFTMLAFCL